MLTRATHRSLPIFDCSTSTFQITTLSELPWSFANTHAVKHCTNRFSRHVYRHLKNGEFLWGFYGVLRSRGNTNKWKPNVIKIVTGKNHNRTSPSPICRSLLVLRVAVFVLALHFDSRYLTFEQTGASFCNILLKRTKNGVVISNFDVEQSKIGGERWVALVSMLTVRWLGPQDSLVRKATTNGSSVHPGCPANILNRTEHFGRRSYLYSW